MPAVIEVVQFLERYPPFDALPASELDAIAALTEIEFYQSGMTILTQDADPVDRVRVVGTGTVELLCDDGVLDLLGTGELFGQSSMMSGLPAGFTARAAEDSTVYSLPADAVQALLSRPGVLRFLLRSVLSSEPDRGPEPDPLRRRVGSLLRMPLVQCGPNEPVRLVAASMTEHNASAMLVFDTRRLRGIVTDTDLRVRVLAAGLDANVPVWQIMTSPVHTVESDRFGGDVLLEMIEHGVKHVPVLSPSGAVLGVLQDQDLVSAQTRTPFILRRQIDRANTADEVAEVAARLRPTVVSLRRSGADAAYVSAVWSLVVDALTQRLLDIAAADSAPFTWLALGSLARRESVPSSDIDSALCWPPVSDDPDHRCAIRAIAVEVSLSLAKCGLPADAHQVSADDPLFSRSLADWQQVARDLLADPGQDKALLLASVLLDHRAVWGADYAHAIARPFAGRDLPQRKLLLHLLGRYALVHKPPTGFLRDFVVVSGGDRRGRLDIKRGGIAPIVDLARWAGLKAGVIAGSTPQRLQAAIAAETLPATEAATLIEAFEVLSEVRVEHQISQLEAGEEPDDFIRPASLTAIARAELKETFRALAAVQRGMHSELSLGLR